MPVYGMKGLHINLNIKKWNMRFKLSPYSTEMVVPNAGKRQLKKISNSARRLTTRYIQHNQTQVLSLSLCFFCVFMGHKGW